MKLKDKSNARRTPKARKAVEKALVLRTCAANMTSNDGRFTWPESGHVEAPDWKPTKECGNGLHGFLRGEGDGSLANWSDDAKWLVVEVAIDSVIDLGGKVKFTCGDVVFCGNREGAISYLKERGVSGAIIGDAVIAGYRGTATAGSYGTATAGSYGTATAGDGGTATAGYRGTATAGSYGTATAGDGGTATAGDGGTATAGYGGTATAGYRGTATAGYGGTATAGDGGTATAGDGGILNIRWWDGQRYRLAVFYVGEDGIEPNAKYRCENGKAVKCEI